MGQGMQRKINKTRSWHAFIMILGLSLLPFKTVIAEPSLDFFWQNSSLYTTPAALTLEELKTAQASTHSGSNQTRISVGPRDTLWSIARTNRPARNITIKQAMIAIRDANPTAFPTGNINEMEAGSSLIIPSASEMRSRTAQQAEEAVRRQNQAWVATRAPQPPQPAQPRARQTSAQPEQAETPAPAEPAEAESEQALQLSSAQQTDEQQALIKELEVRLEQSEDSLHRVEREKDELASRLSEMQGQLDTLQQLLHLKDEQLDELEAQLAEPAAQQPEPQVTLIQPPAPASDDLFELMQRQPWILASLIGLLLLLFFLLLALMTTRRKLSERLKEQAASDEARRREEELHSLMDSNAQPDDFNRDLNAQPLETLDDLGDDFSDLEEVTEAVAEEPVNESKKSRDPLQEAEMFIAYGRLEQAAGFLHKALSTSPEREDLRVKLLEVLVELNDDESFQVQKQQLDAQNPSEQSRRRADELAKLLNQSLAAAAGAATAGAAAKVAANEEAEAEVEDLGEIEWPDDDLVDLESELDQVLMEKPPLEPSHEEEIEEDLSELDALGAEEEESLEQDLEKPLAEDELSEDETDLQDFEPMDYKSDADDFMSALDEINQNEDDLETADQPLEDEQKPTSDLDEELSSLSAELSELTDQGEANLTEENWDDLGDLSDLDSLELDDLNEPQMPEQNSADQDLSGLDDLADLSDELDFSDTEGDLNTQLDLATAYIEMEDKEGAREILEKVIAEGDADQQATARQMLESLST